MSPTNRFCCCLPARLGLATMSLFSILFAGILSSLIWFEFGSAREMFADARAAFIAAGLTETAYFFVSIIGFAAVGAKKYPVVMACAYFIYLHFIVNIGMAVWFIWIVAQAANKNVVIECPAGTTGDEQTNLGCKNTLIVTKGLFIGFTSAVLFVELCYAFAFARYLHSSDVQDKLPIPTFRSKARDDGFRLLPPHSSNVIGEQDRELTGMEHQTSSQIREFDPYQGSSRGVRPSDDFIGPHPDPEQGYGGGLWTHKEIADDEKRRLHDLERQRMLNLPGMNAVVDLRPPPIGESLPMYDFARDGHDVLVDRKAQAEST